MKSNFSRCKCGNYPKPCGLRLSLCIYTEHSCCCRSQKVQRTCDVLERTSHKSPGPCCKTSEFLLAKYRQYAMRSGIFWNLVPSWIIYFLSLWVGSLFHGLFVQINPLGSGWEACSLSAVEHSALNSLSLCSIYGVNSGYTCVIVNVLVPVLFIHRYSFVLMKNSSSKTSVLFMEAGAFVLLDNILPSVFCVAVLISLQEMFKNCRSDRKL